MLSSTNIIEKIEEKVTVVVGNIEIDVFVTEGSKEIKDLEDNHGRVASTENINGGGEEVYVWKEMVSNDEVSIGGRGNLEGATNHRMMRLKKIQQKHQWKINHWRRKRAQKLR